MTGDGAAQLRSFQFSSSPPPNSLNLLSIRCDHHFGIRECPVGCRARKEVRQSHDEERSEKRRGEEGGCCPRSRMQVRSHFCGGSEAMPSDGVVPDNHGKERAARRDRMKDVQRQLNRRHSAQLAWSRMDGTDDRLMFLSPRGPCPAQWKEPVTGFGKPGRSNLIYLMRYWWAPRMLSCPAELRARPRHLRQLSRLQCSIRTPATLVSDLKTEDDSFTKIGFLHLSSSVGLHRRQRHKDLPRRSYVRLLKSNPILSS